MTLQWLIHDCCLILEVWLLLVNIGRAWPTEIVSRQSSTDSRPVGIAEIPMNGTP